MGYRETFFNSVPSLNGKYQCVRCGQWFTKQEIDVDHRIPKKLGGTDDISNLQAMCKHCNRSKGKEISVADIANTALKSVSNGTIGNTVKSAIIQNAKNALGIKYKR